MNYPKAVIRKVDKDSWNLVVDGMSIPNVTEVTYRREPGHFPVLTFTLIAELYQEDEPMEPVENYAPWRDREANEKTS